MFHYTGIYSLTYYHNFAVDQLRLSVFGVQLHKATFGIQ